MSAPNDVGAGGGLPAARSWHCENIGPRQRRKRIRIGSGLLVLGAVLAAVLFHIDAGRALRAIVFLPFAAGSIALFQVRARTCVVFAARGVRDMDGGEVPVADPLELRQLVRQARVVQIQGLALGVALTLAVVAAR